MASSPLCSVCANINFEALRNPLLSDLPALQEGRVDTTRHPFKDRTEDAHISTQLGTLSDIAQRAENCRLCHLIIKSLSRHNGRRPQADDVCRAETSFYGVYRDPTGKIYWARRLSIGIRTPRGSWFHAFQGCNVGALSMEIDLERRFHHRVPADSMIFGGRRRPLLLNLSWVKQWMKICTTDHGEACEKGDIDPGPETKRIRFVDVVKRCVVTIEDVRLSDHEYMALSYVWGGPQKVALLGSNKEKLSEPGALAPGILPQTVEDSIVLAQSLGFRHIWIDALCIVQDDNNDKKLQIGQMSRIYGFASLTVMDATSTNANGGLPGLRADTRSLEQEEIVIYPDSDLAQEGTAATPAPLSLMTTLYPLFNQNEHYLEHTPWNDRGWTMQERVMSRRVLVFMPEQVHWICREATFCEESYFENEVIRFNRFHSAAMEPTLRRSFRNFFEPEDDELRLWSTYSNLIARYTRRNFTYPGDVFDGFLCVLEGLSTLANSEFTWGLPRSHFEQGMLWTPFRGVTRRTEPSTLPMTSLQAKVAFPSWSWMGWAGEVSIQIGNDRLDEEIGETPEILCFQHQHTPLRLEAVSPAESQYQSLLESQVLPGWKERQNQSVTLGSIEANLPNLYCRLYDIPDTTLLFFWTSVAYFTVVPTLIPPAHEDGQTQRTANVVDTNGETIGSMGPMLEEGLYKGPGPVAVIILGSRRNPFSDPMLLVLQVEWRDSIAYRINCGEIQEEAWKNSVSTWQLVALG